MSRLHPFISFIFVIMITYKTMGYMPIKNIKLSIKNNNIRLFSTNQKKYPLSRKYSLYNIPSINYTTNNNDTSDFYKNEGLSPPTQYLQDDNETMYKIKGYFYMRDMLNKLNDPSISILTKIDILQNSTAPCDILEEYIDTLQPNMFVAGLLDDWNYTHY